MIRLVLLLSICATLARAEERPRTLPSRDVDVIYAMGAPGLSQRMRWAAGDGKLRVDPPNTGLYLVMDMHAKTVIAVRDAERAVIDLPPGKVPGLPGAASAGFVRGPAAEVAGLACTEWATRDAAGGEATVCLTGDGVLLRARRGDRIMVEAERVAYGPIDADVFAIPPGYRHVPAGAQP